MYLIMLSHLIISTLSTLSLFPIPNTLRYISILLSTCPSAILSITSSHHAWIRDTGAGPRQTGSQQRLWNCRYAPPYPGIPVIELGFAIQAAGIRYYGFRNEQAAAYSAGYSGFLTGMPGACLCVSGPGHTNAISGLLNAWSNTWPMILISGSNDLSQTSKQAFQ